MPILYQNTSSLFDMDEMYGSGLGNSSGSISGSISGSGSFIDNNDDDDKNLIYIIFLCWRGLIIVVLAIAVIFYIGIGLVLLYHYCIKPPILKCSYSIGNCLQDCSDCIKNSWYNCFKITYNNCFKIHRKIKVIPNNIKEECSICLDENITNTTILKCNHKYHITCLDKWTEECKLKNYKVSCPMCRANIV